MGVTEEYYHEWKVSVTPYKNTSVVCVRVLCKRSKFVVNIKTRDE